MGQREDRSFADEIRDGPCTSPSDEHLSRVAPRVKLSKGNSAGNVIPMNQKKGAASAEETEGLADTLSAADKRRMTDQIGRQLRGMYDGLLNQPVPDRFMDLVKQLESGRGDRGGERDS